MLVSIVCSTLLSAKVSVHPVFSTKECNGECRSRAEAKDGAEPNDSWHDDTEEYLVPMLAIFTFSACHEAAAVMNVTRPSSLAVIFEDDRRQDCECQLEAAGLRITISRRDL